MFMAGVLCTVCGAQVYFVVAGTWSFTNIFWGNWQEKEGIISTTSSTFSPDIEGLRMKIAVTPFVNMH